MYFNELQEYQGTHIHVSKNINLTQRLDIRIHKHVKDCHTKRNRQKKQPKNNNKQTSTRKTIIKINTKNIHNDKHAHTHIHISMQSPPPPPTLLLLGDKQPQPRGGSGRYQNIVATYQNNVARDAINDKGAEEGTGE